ncbi:MAG TPA: MltA domain-containing protein [Albitalea sp.]
MLMSFRRCGRRGWPALILGVLAACASPPREASAPVEDKSPSPAAAAPQPAGLPPLAEIVRARSRWVAVAWSDLPGWDADAVSELWPALLRSCERPGADWARVCSDARKGPPAGDAAARAWLQQRLVPYRVESSEGQAEGLITGYFEPLIEASRVARAGYRVPLYQAPSDLGSRKPYWTRQQVDTLSAAKAQLRGRELAFVADPLDALILQIQGSGRLQLTEPDGERKLVRAAFAGHNEHPYKSVGRWLIEQGELKAEQASWPAIKAWARANPKRVNELLWSNPRMVFFREEPLPDPAIGPKGAQGVPLTPGRSIAVDAQSIPYGTPVWLDTTEPLSNTPLRRVVMAQDTGSAITGAVRADYFWGWGEQAEAQAGRMKQPLRLWALWPRP